jgi:hypothetical protein
MEVHIPIGRGNEEIGINDQHSPSPLHEVVQRVAISDVHARFSTMKGWERTQFLFLLVLGGVKKKAQTSLHQLGHGFSLARSFLTQAGHDRVVDVQRRLHMASHIACMAVCQCPSVRRQLKRHTLVKDCERAGGSIA